MFLDTWVLTRRIAKKNKRTILFTPGPASLAYENLESIGPAFGRGDSNYEVIEAEVLEWIKSISGQTKIIRMQGSATLAIEVGLENFVVGNVLLIRTGFYSDRIATILRVREDVTLKELEYEDALKLTDFYDWVIACPTETSIARLIPIPLLNQLARQTNAQLFLDATASIGLESSHHLADVVCFSSCKGLIGLTGAAFIAFKSDPERRPVNFSLNVDTYLDKRTTGPYHAIQSLHPVIKNHTKMKNSVIANKAKMINDHFDVLLHSLENQPLLCTAVSSKVTSNNPSVVLYQSRLSGDFSIVNHLGEVHLGDRARGKILDELDFS